MAKITTIPLFKDKSLSAGDTGTSDIIDLRDCFAQNKFTLSHKVAVGTSGTCGTTVFSYMGCSIETGTYVSPSTSGTFATSGTIHDMFTEFTPYTVPFMKIVSTQTGAGTAGANSVITAELHVQ